MTSASPYSSSGSFNMSDPGDVFLYYTFHYKPELTSAWIAVGFFAVVTVVLSVLCIKYGGKYMYIAPAMGLVESVGYGLRILIVERRHSRPLGPFIMSTLAILMAPIALALINYIVAAKLLAVTGKSITVCGRLSMTPKRVSRGFFWGDFICFFVQAAGGGMLAIGTEAATNTGTAIVLLGLVIQLMFFFTYIWILYRISTDPSFGLKQVKSLGPVFHGLRVTVLCLLVRNLYRVVEFASAPNGPAYTIEWVFYVFETLPIFLCLVCYCVFHFGRLLDAKDEHPRWIIEYDALQNEARQKLESATDNQI